MQILFKCPQCKGRAIVDITDEDAEAIRRNIETEGRSPPLIVRCDNRHELLVTVSAIPSGDGFCIRDVAIPRRKGGSKDAKGSEGKDAEWLMRAFGGEEE